MPLGAIQFLGFASGFDGREGDEAGANRGQPTQQCVARTLSSRGRLFPEAASSSSAE